MQSAHHRRPTVRRGQTTQYRPRAAWGPSGPPPVGNVVVGLEIRLTGAPTVSVDGAPLHVDTRKAVALLARLAVAGPRSGRDVLATLLWPDASQDRARASLRRTLSALTTGLGGRWVTADRADVALAGDDVTCDVRELQRHLEAATSHDHPPAASCDACRAGLTAAAGWWRGEFMEGFALRDAPAFEDWLLLEGEALRRSVATVLERLTLQHTAVGAHDEALASAHRWVALDPLHEEAHRAVMRVAAAAGRRDEASRQFRECVAALDRELGVAPLPATVELHQAILDGDLAEPAVAVPRPRIAPPVTPVPAPRPPDRIPLVDRADELAALVTRLDDPSDDATFISIEGEAGIGKTRLVEEVLDRAAAGGHRVLHVRCNEGEQGLAGAPLVDLLRDALRHDPGLPGRLDPHVASEAARIVPELAGPTGAAHGDLELPGARARFLDAVGTSLVEAVAGSRRGVVAVDDLHWADETTIEVLGFLARRPAGRPVVVLTTWRTEAVPLDHPVRQLGRTAAAGHVTLGRLAASDVEALVASVRPEVVGLSGRLYEETEGIPFFVVQYLMTWDGSSDWQLPAPVRDLVLTRLRPLSDLGRQCLTAAAVLGRAADVDVLGRVSGRSEDEVVAALDELLTLGLVREDPRGYDLTHTKIRDVAHESASLARRRLLHRRAAEALLRRHRDDPSAAATVARHLRAAGDDAAAAEELVRAAAHARSVFANSEALDHLETALGLGHPDPSRLRAEVGDLHALSGRYADARADYDAAAALAADDATRADVARRLGMLLLRRGDWIGASRALRTTLELLPDAAPSVRAPVVADLALVALRQGVVDEARSRVDEALALAAAAPDARTVAETHNVAGLVARRTGDLDRARSLLERALDAASEHGDPDARIAALNNLALVLQDQGTFEAALEVATDALDLSRARGDRHREAALHSNVADVLHALDRTDEAMVHLKESARLLAEVDEPTAPEPEIWKLRDW